MINKSVIVSTKYRGVYQGLLMCVDDENQSCILANANMVIYWGTTNGIDQLANSGPTEKSKIGAVVEKVKLFGITHIAICGEKAIKKWIQYK